MQETDPYRHPVETPGFRSRFGGLWTDLSNARDLVAGRLAIGDMSWTPKTRQLAKVEPCP